MKLLVVILFLTIHCTSLDKMLILGIKNPPPNDRGYHQYLVIKETGESSECLLPSSAQYPFPRIGYCYVGGRELRLGNVSNEYLREPSSFITIIPGYLRVGHANSEFYKDVTLGRGPFHNRSLKENILRQSMQQSLPGKIPTIQYSR
ncbi:hypothetical protein JWG40_15660 [Leptospira sp. 201903074]|uniref:hypothetical protein n=1 Tax=Leptospira abararensis TaxID=2810036 RepID=UPI0019642F46|nr:hypothetical protein [Leptospira abararensis]MBM9548464.1 hypothetical protein [Leptospira abararensis]